MKVLHVIPGIAWRYGGTTATIRSLCGELAQAVDIEIELATTDADGPRGRLDACEVPQQYPVHLFRRTATEKWKYSRGLGMWLRKNVGHFDLVHIHALWSFASNAAARAACRAHVPYIVRPAGMLSEYTFAHQAWKKRLYWQISERSTIELAAAFHATSSAEREDILRVRRDARVHVIPNGVDESAWTTASRPNRNEIVGLDQADQRPVILFMSRLHPKKGITDLLLPAMARVRVDADLVIAGDLDAHEPEYANRVRKEVSRLGLTDRVRLLGPIPAERRWEMYNAADVFVLPSHSENFGIVVAEAMAKGCPVVITDQVQAREHVVAADAGIVVSSNVDALAQALTELLSNAKRRNTFGENGLTYAKSNFRWGQIVDRVGQMYRETSKGQTRVV